MYKRRFNFPRRGESSSNLWTQQARREKGLIFFLVYHRETRSFCLIIALFSDVFLY